MSVARFLAKASEPLDDFTRLNLPLRLLVNHSSYCRGSCFKSNSQYMASDHCVCCTPFWVTVEASTGTVRFIRSSECLARYPTEGSCSQDWQTLITRASSPNWIARLLPPTMCTDSSFNPRNGLGFFLDQDLLWQETTATVSNSKLSVRKYGRFGDSFISILQRRSLSFENE